MNQVEGLSHTMWVLSGLIGFLRNNGYIPSDQPCLVSWSLPCLWVWRSKLTRRLRVLPSL